jgi:predicted dehydrogenase
LKDGRLELVQVPEPSPGPGAISVRLEASVLSAGTERASLDVARKGLLAKARARPDQARKVLDRVRSEGLVSTVAMVRDRLEELGPMGYSAAGTVIEAGGAVRGIQPGDRVALAGAGFANHAEVDIVPSLLCAPVPDGVSAEEAAFTTLGAIAMNGFRRSEAQLGSTVAVIGLGLIGQLATRIALAAGCRVLGVDPKAAAVKLAANAGAEAVARDEIAEPSRWDNRADAVLICAATSNSDPISVAARLARDRAAVVMVGDVAMDVPRGPFYEKELDLRLSRSYGPGRYDPAYELHGIDYPIGHVRWTEQRNMASFLELIREGKLSPSELVTHRFPIAEAEQAFETLDSDGTVVGVVLDYTGDAELAEERVSSIEPRRKPIARSGSKPRFGLIGAGSFAAGTVVPGLREAGFSPGAVASASGLSAESLRQRFDFEAAYAEPAELIAHADLDLVVVATQHDSHAKLAVAALEAGIPVYVEKPLALDGEELSAVVHAQRRAGVPLLVGFNRRHAPLAAELRALPGPKLMAYRVNAGRLSVDHWTNDLARGGGRLLGEGCHFVDFLCDQAGSDPVTVVARGFPSDPQLPLTATDNFSLQLTFVDGSVGTVNYGAHGPTAAGKEEFQVTAPDAYGVIDDFRSGKLWLGSNSRRLGARRQDKGLHAQFRFFADVISGRIDAPTVDGYVISTLATLAAARSLETGAVEPVVSEREKFRPGGSGI